MMRRLRGVTAFALATALASSAAAKPPKRPHEIAVAVVAPTPEPAETTPPLVVAVHGGLTAADVAARAAQTSYTARAAEGLASAAEARTAQAWIGFIPRIDVVASYTRLSDFVPPSLTGGASLVATPRAPGTLNPAPTVAVGFAFPNVLDDYLLRATLVVPVSDYFLRIGQALSAATSSEEAARYDVVAARAKAASDGKIAYYTWLRTRGATTVAEQTLAVAKAHLHDTEQLFQAGGTSRADVLRAETQVAAAELGIERTKNAAALAERRVRVAVHAKENETLAPGETLDAALAPGAGSLRSLVGEAHAQRPEIKSIEKNADVLRDLAAVKRAGRIPVLSAVGDATYANPNPRVFPPTSEWLATWAVGARVTWSPDDFLYAGPAGEEQDAKALALDAQKGALRDAIELEVAEAYHGVLTADASISTSARELESALEGFRVARDLYTAGRGTGTSLIDAENALTKARFDELDAKVDARIARVRLEHAVGRDAHP